MKWFKLVSCSLAMLLLVVSYIVSCRSVSVSDEELTDFTTAVQMNNDELQTPFVNFLGKDIPIVNSPYQGSLKSWIVAPFLKVFGTSVYVNRFINLILSVLYLLSLFWAAKMFLSKKFAFLVFLIPILDTKFLLYAPFDYGPFLFQLIFISLSIGGIVRFIKLKDIKWWYFSNFTIGAILAQKLTSFPAFLTLLLVNNIYYLKFRYKNWITLRTFWEISISIFYCLLPLLSTIYYFVKYGFTDFLVNSVSSEIITFWNFWPKLLSVFITFLSGFNGVFWVKGSTITTDVKSMFVFFPYISLLLVGWKTFKMFQKEKRDYFSLLLILTVLLFLIFTLVRGLTRSHHFFILEPFWMLMFFVALIDFINIFKKKWWCIVFILLVFIGMLVNDLAMLGHIYRNKGAVLSSMAIYDLSNKLDLLGAKKVYSLNFSLSAPIYYLSNGKIKTVNLMWNSLDEEELTKYINEVKFNNDTYLVARRSNNYYWSVDWIDWLNKDRELSSLIDNTENFGLEKALIEDKRGTTFYIFKRCTLDKKDAKICR